MKNDLKTANILTSVQKMFSLDRPFPCTKCELRFTKLISLQDHENSHKNFKFKCEGCGRTYWTKAVLNEHQRRFHKEINEEIRETPIEDKPNQEMGQFKEELITKDNGVAKPEENETQSIMNEETGGENQVLKVPNLLMT